MVAPTVDQSLRDVAERVRTAVAADRCTIYELDRERNEIFSRVALGVNQELRFVVGEGLVGFVARSGRPLRLRDAYNDPRFDASIDRRTGYRTKSVACVPVTDVRGLVLGAIQAINKADGPFNAQDVELLGSFTEEVAAILQAR